MLIAEIAAYLHAQGLGTFDELGATGTIYLEMLPPTPDEVILIRATGGSESDVKLPYDNLTVQVLVRGTENISTAQAKAQSIYDALHGYKGDEFTGGGSWIVGCIGVNAGPAYIGADANGRHEYSLNFRLIVHNSNRRT